MVEYKNVQIKTYLPPAEVKGYEVEEFEENKIILIKTPEKWVELNLIKKEFSVGEYEG